MRVLTSFIKAYRKKGKSRRRCKVCSKKIMDNEVVEFTQVEKEKFYPIKGLMYFKTWNITHITC